MGFFEISLQHYITKLHTHTGARYNYKNSRINYKGVAFGGHFPDRIRISYIQDFIFLYNQPIFKKIENKPIAEQVANKLQFWDRNIIAFLENGEFIIYSYNEIRTRWVPGYPTLAEFEELIKIELGLSHISLKQMKWFDK